MRSNYATSPHPGIPNTRVIPTQDPPSRFSYYPKCPYLEEARKKEPLLPAPQPSVTISLKMPANLARKLQAHAAASNLTASEVMRQAVTAFLASVDEDG